VGNAVPLPDPYKRCPRCQMADLPGGIRLPEYGGFEATNYLLPGMNFQIVVRMPYWVATMCPSGIQARE
jgi:hypothetical protein